MASRGGGENRRGGYKVSTFIIGIRRRASGKVGELCLCPLFLCAVGGDEGCFALCADMGFLFRLHGEGKEASAISKKAVQEAGVVYAVNPLPF